MKVCSISLQYLLNGESYEYEILTYYCTLSFVFNCWVSIRSFFFVPSHEYIEFCSKIPKNAYFEVGMIHRTSEIRSRWQTVWPWIELGTESAEFPRHSHSTDRGYRRPRKVSGVFWPYPPGRIKIKNQK